MLVFNIMNERQRKLLEKLRLAGAVTIEAEAAFFGTSAMTIRRDLQALEDAGLALRTHGGAALRGDMHGELVKLEGGTEAQKRIAAAAVGLLPAGATVMLSAGTTTLELARRIALANLRLMVVTNSLPHAAALFRSDNQVLLTGGTLRGKSMDLVGPLAEKNLGEYYIDVLVAGCDGADSTEGFFTSDMNLAAMERKSVEVSGKVLVVTESHKFRKRSFVKYAELDKVAAVVTDKLLPDADRLNLERAGVEVILA